MRTLFLFFFFFPSSSRRHILLKLTKRFLAFLFIWIVPLPKVKIHVGASRRGAAELLHWRSCHVVFFFLAWLIFFSSTWNSTADIISPIVKMKCACVCARACMCVWWGRVCWGGVTSGWQTSYWTIGGFLKEQAAVDRRRVLSALHPSSTLAAVAVESDPTPARWDSLHISFFFSF